VLRILLLMAVAAVSVTGCTSTSPEERGRRLYAERGCIVCHGAGGRGDGPSAPRLDAQPRDFTDVRAYRLGSSQDDIVTSIRAGGGAMPSFRDVSEPDAKDIAAWIVSLQRQAGGSGGKP
jgi:mono/diheme cytochrome c family protein